MNKEETKQYFIDLYVEHIKQESIPEWANWVATDADGEVWVYQEKPVAKVKAFYNEGVNAEAICLDIMVNFCEHMCWRYSCLKLKELLPHYPSQQKEESMQDKIEFEAVSGDQSLFDLVGANNKDMVIVKSMLNRAIFAMTKSSPEYTILAERKVKEKSYIPEVGHTYKLSTRDSGTFTCVFVGVERDVWSTCDGVMFTHYVDYLLREGIGFIRVR